MAVMSHAAKVLKQVMVNIGGNKGRSLAKSNALPKLNADDGAETKGEAG